MAPRIARATLVGLCAATTVLTPFSSALGSGAPLRAGPGHRTPATKSSRFVGSASSAWAGFVVSAESRNVQVVSARWNVPRIACAKKNSSAATAAWIGVNGWVATTPGLFQVGTNSRCRAGVASSVAWWSDQSIGYAQRFLFAAAAGDQIAATVRHLPSGKWSYELRDLTSHASASRAETLRATGRSAEWIVEDPSANGLSRRVPLAPFTRITFRDLTLTTAPSSWRRLTAREAVEMVSGRGALEAIPRFEGEWDHRPSFSVTYVAPRKGAPQPPSN